MEKIEIYFGIATIILSAIFSGIVSLIVSKVELKRKSKREVFEKFYNKFYVLRDTIHQGCAYDFSDLSYENQEKIVILLMETDCYQNKEISDLVYELKTSRLNNFNNLEKNNINRCNEIYNLLSEKIINKYCKYKKK